MKQKGFSFTLAILTLCINLSQPLLLYGRRLNLVCPVVSEEYKNYAVPSNCSLYYECHYGEPVVYSCEPGFLFNVVNERCDFPSNVDCNRDSPTRSPVITTSSSGFVCPVFSNEYKNYADPEDCSKYYECHQGEKVSYSCAQGFLFNPVKGLCDFASDVNCGSTQIPFTRAPVTSTSSPDFVCPVFSNEYKNYANPADCSKYYECHQGVKVSYSCPNGFLFNPVKELCDFASDVDCNSTQIPSTRAPVTPSPDFVCPVFSNEYENYANPADCSKYYECHQGEKVSYSCPSGFLFNPVKELCDFASNVDCNSTQIPSTRAPVTSTSSPDFVCPVFSNEYKNYANPADCSKYYECHQGEKVSYSCPNGFLFNPVKELCDFAADVDCNSTQIPSTRTPVTSTSSPDFVCPVISNEYKNYADPADCSKFYECHQGEKISLSCPQGFLFNPVKGLCDFASDVNCNSTEIPTRAPVTSTSSPDFSCPVFSEDYIKFPDPTNCSRYYECHLGQKELYSCAPGFFFDPVKKMCNFDSEVICFPTTVSTLEPTTRNPRTPTRSTISTYPTRLTSPNPVTETSISPVTSNPSTQSTTSGGSTEPTDNICKDKPNGAYIADPNDCRKFYECVWGKPQMFTCPSGAVWVEKDLSCEFTDNEC